ncbi:MAG TPA: TauD/TfdA family dioxygenase, partial [Myxococcaceae bacterium]|nr:TauD/TfdA family dioxygenase [Myxococcaceae bacterium]
TPAEVFEGLKRLLAEHSVVLLRDQAMTEEEQLLVNRRFGPSSPVPEHVWPPPVEMTAKPGSFIRWGERYGRLPLINKGELIYFPSGPELCDKETDTYSVWDEEERHDKGKGSSCWHTGDTEKFDYEVLSMLYAEVAATSGGNTSWCDTVASYEALDEGTRKRMDGLRAIHYFTYREGSPPVSQALVKTHPITGRKHFYLNFVTMERIEGMTRQESYDVLKMLFHHQCRPEFIYTHQWRDGDTILWNNNTTMHKRGALVSGVRRIMRRTQVLDPAFQSGLPWDKTRPVEGHDGGHWFPYPFTDSR